MNTPDNPAAQPEPSGDPAAKAARELFQRWQQGLVPLEDVLDRAGELKTPDLIEVLLSDMHHRWEKGERITALEYVERYPKIRTDLKALAELLGGQALLREDRDEVPVSPEDFQHFPEINSELRRLQNGAASGSVRADCPTDATATHGAGMAEAGNAAWPDVPGYEILSVLGRGGMGVVYKARHLKLKRLVALKMILAGQHAEPKDLARFRDEAEVNARLRHPNIVEIYEVGEYEGKPFLSLEFVDGGSLDKKLGGTPLPASEAAALVETLARAMQAAHDQRVVHRDLKPANVLLANGGTPKVSDFGLAKKVDEAGQTQSGTILGTPSYMAPEQAKPGRTGVGPLADVYALGAILYDCLTGRPPFKAATALDTMLQVVSDEPVPPRELNTKVPGDLETICLKCLRKEPAKRYESAAALAEDMRRFGEGRPIMARPVGRLERAAKWVRRNPALAAMMLALFVATVVSTIFGIVAWHRAAEAEGARANEAHQKEIAEQRREDAEKARADEAHQKEIAEQKRKDAEEARANEEKQKTIAQDNLADALEAIELFLRNIRNTPTLTLRQRDDRKFSLMQLTARYDRLLANSDESSRKGRQLLGRTCHGRGTCQALLGSRKVAEENFCAARLVQEQLAKESDELLPRAEYSADLAVTLLDLARLYRDGGRLQEADKVHERLQGMLTSFDTSPKYRTACQQKVAFRFFQLGEWEEVLVWQGKVIDALEEQLRDDKNNPQVRGALCQALWLRALSLMYLGRRGEAVKDWLRWSLLQP